MRVQAVPPPPRRAAGLSSAVVSTHSFSLAECVAFVDGLLAAPERAAPERAAPELAAPKRAAPERAECWGVHTRDPNFREPVTVYLDRRAALRAALRADPDAEPARGLPPGVAIEDVIRELTPDVELVVNLGQRDCVDVAVRRSGDRFFVAEVQYL